MAALLAGQTRLAGPFNGLLKITETVTVSTAPAARPVALLDQITLQPRRLAESDAVSGVVTFANISAGPWVLLSRDPGGEYQAVAVSDRLATLDGSRS